MPTCVTCQQQLWEEEFSWEVPGVLRKKKCRRCQPAHVDEPCPMEIDDFEHEDTKEEPVTSLICKGCYRRTLKSDMQTAIFCKSCKPITPPVHAVETTSLLSKDTLPAFVCSNNQEAASSNETGKTCPRCHEWKALRLFPRDTTTTDSCGKICTSCLGYLRQPVLPIKTAQKQCAKCRLFFSALSSTLYCGKCITTKLQIRK